MVQSELLMQGVEFAPFTVNLDGFEAWSASLYADINEAAEKLAQYTSANPNSTKEVKMWFESLGIDCSRGTGKEVYENPVNIAIAPAELKAFARVKTLESLRRKEVTFRKLLTSSQPELF